MQLTIREVSDLLGVPEKTIHRWIKQGQVAAYRVNDQYRFNRAELLESIRVGKIRVAGGLFREQETASGQTSSLVAALDAGGIFHEVEGSDQQSVLRNVVAHLPLPDPVDREFVFQLLLAREQMQSTAIGDGIAIPHVRNPIVLPVFHPSVTLCFLQQPIEFGAPDGQPVFALFSLISPTVRSHLRLLGQLAFALSQAGFRAAIVRRAPRETILEEARRAEAAMALQPRVTGMKSSRER